MAAPVSNPSVPEQHAVPGPLFNACFVLFVINAAFFPTAYFAHWWITDPNGFGIPIDFVNVWSRRQAGARWPSGVGLRLGYPEAGSVGLLGQTFVGHFAWHYPPPFLFVAAFLAQFPYAVAFIGWVSVSLVPYLVTMRAIVGRPFGWLLAAAFPVVLTNTLVG